MFEPNRNPKNSPAWPKLGGTKINKNGIAFLRGDSVITFLYSLTLFYQEWFDMSVENNFGCVVWLWYSSFGWEVRQRNSTLCCAVEVLYLSYPRWSLVSNYLNAHRKHCIKLVWYPTIWSFIFSYSSKLIDRQNVFSDPCYNLILKTKQLVSR